MESALSDIAAEKILLGYILSSSEPLLRLFETPPSTSDFENVVHSEIFDISVDQFKRGAKRVNVKALSQQLQKHPATSGMQTNSIIQALVAENQGLEAALDAVRRLKDAAVRRTIMSEMSKAAPKCKDYGCDTTEIISDIMRCLSEATTTNSSARVVDQMQATTEAWGEISAAIDNNGVCMGIPTQFNGLNRLTSGLYPGDYSILAGRPGTGKTALALNIVSHIASAGTPVLFFSLEMPRAQLLKRMISASLRVDARKFRGIGQFTEEEIAILHSRKIDEIGSLPIRHFDFPAIKPFQLRSICHAEKQKSGIKVVVVDYIGLVHPEKKTGQRYLDVGETSETLRCIAKELNVHILALAQMNRNIDMVSREPVLSDLRESGNLEQDTDNVWFLSPGEGAEDGDKLKQIILKVAKNRHGPEGRVNLWFERQYLNFIEMTAQKQGECEGGSI